MKKKRDFIIRKTILKYWNTPNNFHALLSFYATQISNLRISANLDKVQRFSTNEKIPYKGGCFSIVESRLDELRKLTFDYNFESK